MRFKRVELSPNNKRQYLFAVGARDVELLLGEALNASKHTPSTKENKYDIRRLNAIVKGLKDAMKVIEKDNDDGTRIPQNERDQYSNEDTGNPLEDITRLEIIDHRPCVECGDNEMPGWFPPADYGERPKECQACNGLGVKGRQVVFWDNKVRVESSVQDNGKTLKLFVDTIKEPQTNEVVAPIGQLDVQKIIDMLESHRMQ